MNNYETIKKCKYCNKNIDLYLYKSHKKKCMSQMIVNPTEHLLINHKQVITHFLEKYNQLYLNYLNNKTIALIGPAESITNTNKGHIIDQFDVVVRLNKSLPLPSNLANDIGTKTNILYNSLNTCDFPGENKFSNSFLKEFNIHFLCCPYPLEIQLFQKDILHYIQRSKFELPFRCMSLKNYKQLENSLQTRPFTGVCAIVELLSYPIKYLYISGLDFYYTKYYNSYRRISNQQQKNNQNNYIHKSKPQINLLKHLSLFDDRIILDSFLDKLLYKKYYETTERLLKINSNRVFLFDNPQIQHFFEMNICNITYSLYSNHTPNNENPSLIITNNKLIPKKNNTYLLFVCNDILHINNLNKNLEEKKYIGNFFYKKNNNINIKNNAYISIYLNSYFIQSVKNILKAIHIQNINIHFLMLLSLMIYSKDNHYFNTKEIEENWGLNIEEKKYFLFLKKKNIFNQLSVQLNQDQSQSK